MKPTMLKTAFTVVLAGLSSYFGMLTQPLLVLFFAMVLGVPGFPRLNRLLSRLKSTVNEKEDEHDT